MKKVFKRSLALLSSLLITAGAVSSVSAAELHRAIDGKLIFFRNDQILIVSDRTDDKFETGQVFDCYNGIINVVKELPSAEEEFEKLEEIRDGRRVWPKTTYWVEGDSHFTDYVIAGQEFNHKIFEFDFDSKLNLRYIFNFDDMSIYDYKTSEKLGEIEDFAVIIDTVIDDNGCTKILSNISQDDPEMKVLVSNSAKQYNKDFNMPDYDYSSVRSGGWINFAADFTSDSILNAKNDSLSLLADLNDEISVGDINGSGAVDLTDLSELSLAVLGDSTLSEDQTTAADIDGDGDLTVADLSRLKQYVSNQITSLR